MILRFLPRSAGLEGGGLEDWRTEDDDKDDDGDGGGEEGMFVYILQNSFQSQTNSFFHFFPQASGTGRGEGQGDWRLENWVVDW